MHLYFSPLACSLATRIAFYEAGVDADYVLVDTAARRLADGGDFLAINPLGQVPVLRTDDGLLLRENTAILPYVADVLPGANLAPADRGQRALMQQWLGFVATELHKGVFIALLDAKAPEGAKAYAREKAALRLDVLDRHLAGREFLLDAYSVADAYLATVLNWAAYCGVDLAGWPAVKAYFQRVAARPAVARALAEELALYRAEQARKAA